MSFFAIIMLVIQAISASVKLLQLLKEVIDLIRASRDEAVHTATLNGFVKGWLKHRDDDKLEAQLSDFKVALVNASVFKSPVEGQV